MRCIPKPVFRQLQEQGADFLLTVKANQKSLRRQIHYQILGKRKIPFVATDHEVSHGRNITWKLRAKQAPEHIRENWIGTSWIVEVMVTGIRDGKPFQATHLFLTSLRTTPEALLQLVRDRWSIEGWQWIRVTQLHEVAHRYRGNGAGAMDMLRTAALNLLRLDGFHSIRAGLQAEMHDITALMASTPPRRPSAPEKGSTQASVERGCSVATGRSRLDHRPGAGARPRADRPREQGTHPRSDERLDNTIVPIHRGFKRCTSPSVMTARHSTLVTL